MSRPRYHIEQCWSMKHSEMRWYAIDGDSGNAVGLPKDIGFYRAEDAMTFCEYLNAQAAKEGKGQP